MAAADVLLDSNVLLYALSNSPAEKLKRNRAAQLIAVENFGISYQVIMEIWVVATRKMVRPVAAGELAAFLEQLLVFPCVFGTPGLYRQAAQIAHRYGVHPYDAAILAAAHELGAHTVYSEDLNHGQAYGGVEVINPFQDLSG